MANPLTGDYDVVVEIAVGAIDRILATAHQQSASEAASPQFPYSLTARVGDRPKIVQFELAEAMLEEYFGHGKVDIGSLSDDVLAELQDQVAVAKTTRRKLADIADPSAATGPLVGAIENLASLSVVRGLARIQLGTPTLALTPGSSTKLSVRAQIRAAYYPDPGTNELPKPIHGEVLATFLPTYNASGSRRQAGARGKARRRRRRVHASPRNIADRIRGKTDRPRGAAVRRQQVRPQQRQAAG